MGAFKKYDGSVWQSINPKILKGVPYTGTLPAVLTGTKAGYLHKYKIDGNLSQNGTPTPENPIVPSECGERTRNKAWTGWAQDFVTRIDNSNRARIETIDGRTCLWYSATAGSGEYDSKYIFKTDWKENTQYTVSFDALRLSTETDSSVFRIRYTDGTYKELPSKNSGEFENYSLTSQENKTIQDIIAKYTSGNFRIDIDTFMVNEGSTALPYEPYGYKLPLLSGSTPVDIYIGDTPLGTDEYVDYGTQKIYKDVDIWNPNGTTINNQGETRPGNTLIGNIKYSLKNNSAYTFYYRIGASSTSSTAISAGTELSITPSDTLYIWSPVSAGMSNFLAFTKQFVDPPVPFPEIPTTANSTTISWAGQGLAPSEFDSIQEWVDIPTYTYTNGEWVADNSN